MTTAELSAKVIRWLMILALGHYSGYLVRGPLVVLAAFTYVRAYELRERLNTSLQARLDSWSREE